MHGGDVWKYSQQINKNSTEILDFSANINPLGPPPGVKEEIIRAVGQVTCYPEPQARSLRAKLAECYGVDPREVIVGNGAAELIFLYCRAREGLRAVMPAPTFSEYALACRAAAGEVHRFPLQEEKLFRVLAEDFLGEYAQWKEKQRQADPCTAGRIRNEAVFLCQPNNPTGGLIPHRDLQSLVEKLAGAGAEVFLDLSFLSFVSGNLLENGTLPEVPVDIFREIIRAKGLFLLFSFTKMFALPGIRLGFGMGNRELIAAMEEKRDPWTVNVIAQRAGMQCLQEAEYVRKSIEALTAARLEMAHRLEKIGGIKVFPGSANFLLCHLRERGIKASTLVSALAGEGILIRSAANFPGLDPYYIRLAIRLPEENAVLLEKLNAALKQL